MMETKKLREADFITSVLLILFGAWVLFEAFQMPMKGTYGGVKNAWYVSPALLPLVIGICIVLLGITLLLFSIRHGGAAGFLQKLKHIQVGRSEASERFLAIIIAFVCLVYLFIPRVDFFLSVWFFLSYMIITFYYDDAGLLRRLSIIFTAENLLMLALFALGIARLLNSVFRYATDVVALGEIIFFHIAAARVGRSSEVLKKRYKIASLIAVVVPLVLAPIFRYALLVPLPTEGGIIDLMSLIYFSLR